MSRDKLSSAPSKREASNVCGVIAPCRSAVTGRGHRIVEGAKSMKYQKIDLELIVFSEESDAVVAELNSAIDRLEETHTIFGGGIDTVPIEHSGARRRSALRHVLDAGDTATSVAKLAAQKVADAYKIVI